MQRYFSSGERRGLALLGIVMAVTTAIAFLTSERHADSGIHPPTPVATETEPPAAASDTTSTASVRSSAQRSRRKATKTRRERKPASAPQRRSPLDEPF